MVLACEPNIDQMSLKMHEDLLTLAKKCCIALAASRK
jgi:hypothetical protein